MASGPRRIDDLGDPGLAPLRDLPRRTDRAEVVIEGELALHRALAAGVAVHTVVSAPSRRQALRGVVGPTVDWIELDEDALRRWVGFAFHRGVLGVAHRPPSASVDALVEAGRGGTATFVLGERIADPSNVGALIRNAVALGASATIVGSGADPWSRRAIRASAGHVFGHPLCTSADPQRVVARLRDEVAGLVVVAATVDDDAMDLSTFRRRGPLLLMFGNEGEGLSEALLRCADHRVRIEMAPGIDSLNVAAASAVTLWALGPRRRQ